MLLILIGAEISTARPAAGWAVPAALGGAVEPAGSPVATPPPRATPHDRLVAALLAKSLFYPRRRAASAPPAAAAATATMPRLTGTIVAGTGERLALLVPDGEARALIVREGGQACGLLVVRITPGQVVAEGRDGRLTLRVAFNAAVPTALASFANTQDPRQHAPTDHAQ